jgi:hypothetical protein
MQQRRAKLPDRLQFVSWKRGRAVEGTGLENRRRGNPFVSSNLTASAKFKFLDFNGSKRKCLSSLGSGSHKAECRQLLN